MSRYEKISLEKFDEMVKDHDQSLVDFKVKASKMEYHGNGIIQLKEENAFGKLELTGKCNDNGWFGLCDRLGAPASWIQSEKCPDDLDKTIIDRLKSIPENEMLFRYRTNANPSVIRAVLSDKYLPYNHLDLWQDIQNSIEGTKLSQLNPVIWKPHVSDYMDTWILFDGVDADPENGGNINLYDGGGAGGLKPAIHVKNSEDGTGSVRINAGFYRSYCTNGVIFGFQSDANLRAVHRGNSKHFMRTKVAMAVAESARLCGLGINKFLKATQMEIKTDVIDDIVNQWSRDYKFTKAETKEWTGQLSGVRTWADLVMSTSDYAGTLKDREQATRYEELSGSLLMARVPERYLA